MAYRTGQVAEFLGITTDKVRKSAARGKLKGIKHSNGRNWLFEKEDIASYVINHYECYQYFKSCKPRKAFQNSYDILRKEVEKQYDFKWNC